ncbi:MAG: hypothetical protein DI598_17835 [Pseudopedobacter saltans]|uniref:Uncharacterized protein n=1 Tax=Pseudopedobacter saltans TaxID=151895 RepID=A0A2W5G8F2_9SPHI|nr:MAG: hypothetical protein DI598_17835 [Pseudopedobacter saltans]
MIFPKCTTGYGNIGVRFIDSQKEKSKNTFLFESYILKAFDENKGRFFKRIISEEKYTINDIETNSLSIFSMLLQQYISISDSDLKDTIPILPKG